MTRIYYYLSSATREWLFKRVGYYRTGHFYSKGRKYVFSLTEDNLLASSVGVCQRLDIGFTGESDPDNLEQYYHYDMKFNDGTHVQFFKVLEHFQK